MSLGQTWISVGLTVGVLVLYELVLMVMGRVQPERLARTTHASLRQEWFAAMSAQKGSEILAVQTLRNSLMSATMLASTAALGLMGAVTLATPHLNVTLGDATAAGSALLTPRMALELVLITLLFLSLVSTVMAVRFYNHAGFVSAIPVGSDARAKWETFGAAYVRKAGLLYSWGLRQLILVAPVVACIVLPAAGPVAAALVTMVLFAFDSVQATTSPPSAGAAPTGSETRPFSADRQAGAPLV